MRKLTDYMLAIRSQGAPPVPAGIPVIDLAPGTGEDAIASTIDGLRAGDLRPADFRSRVVLFISPGPDALVQYAVLCGFAGRRLDVFVDGALMELSVLHQEAVRLGDAGRPPVHLMWAQVGGDLAEGMPTVRLGGTAELVSPEVASVIRYAARLRMVPAAGVPGALAALVVVAALRRRGVIERFPFLSTGQEPTPATKDAADQGIDLERARHEGWRCRQAYRMGNAGAEVVPEVEVPPYYRRITEANEVSIQDVLHRLGSSPDEDGSWHCPRPDRHSNGDRNPSMRVHRRNKAKCPRCDAEKVTPVRLVVDVLGLSPDEAAAFILDSARVIDMRRALAGSADARTTGA